MSQSRNHKRNEEVLGINEKQNKTKQIHTTHKLMNAGRILLERRGAIKSKASRC